MASFKCADLGRSCAYEFKGAKDANGAMSLAATDAKSSQGISNAPPDLVPKLQKAIKGLSRSVASGPRTHRGPRG